MATPCSSAEITAPRALAACVPFSAPIVLSSTHFRRICRAVSLSVDGLLVLSSRAMPRGQALRVAFPLQGKRPLEVAAVVAHESMYLGRPALDIRFINLGQRDRLLIEAFVARPMAHETPRRDPPPAPVDSRRRSTTIAACDDFDGLPSTDELDSLLAKTLAELQEPASARKKKRKRGFLW